MTCIVVDKTIHHAKPHSIFLPQYQKNKIFALTIEVHVLHYANELLVRVRLFFQKLLQTRLYYSSDYIAVNT